MQFGICVATKIDDWQLIKYAEDLGYERAWVPDSQMIWSDCYATLALAAHNTSRIKRTFLMPEERRFMTTETIQGSCLVGEPNYLLEQIRRAEKVGLKEVTLLPPMAFAHSVFKDFAAQVMARY